MYTGNKNLTYKTFAFNTERVMRWMRWRLILEEYNPELIYIQGAKNVAADSLSRLDIVDINNPVKPNMSSLSEYFSLEKRMFYNQLITKLSCNVNKTINL